MLITRQLDRYEKLRHLGGMATDDILSGPTEDRSVARPDWHGVAAQGGATPHAGVYRAAMPNGKRISLLRVMFTDHCVMDCHYCPNSHWVPRQRYGFKVDELANLFDEMHSRGTVAGLFLSSGIFRDPDHTQERLVNVVEAIRKRGFRGYVHLKVMPGSSDSSLIEAAQRLGTRLSVNIEAPTAEHLAKLSKMKSFNEGMLRPISRISDVMKESYSGAVGQATQMVVGAADESDLDIYTRVRSLYDEMGFKRVYYAAFRPIKYTPLEEHPPTPVVREHRLYQMDWLSRFYKLGDDDLRLAFDDDGFLDHRTDPKLMIASQQIERFPVDVNVASEPELLRVPGIGPIAASRIVANRARSRIATWRELSAMGVVQKRARHFVRFPGHRPEPVRQGELALDGTGNSASPSRSRVVAEMHAQFGPTGCQGCPLNAATCGHG